MAIKLENLTKSYDKNRIVIDNISLEFYEKEVFALLGPNGAGKTTIINLICGLLKRDSGNILVSELDPEKFPAEVRKQIGLVPQETALYEYLTAKENLMFHARFYGVPRSKRKKVIQEALELAQLEERKNDLVSTFSGGMKRRLALVRALLHKPRILILDEPTLGIDVQNRNEIWNRIRELKETKTILVNTNYMDEADRLADRCGIIDKGSLIVLDKPNNLKMKYAGGVRLEATIAVETVVLNELKINLQTISKDVRIKEMNGTHNIVIPTKGNATQLLVEVSQIFENFSKIEVKDLNIRNPTLNDVFLELTGSKLRD